AESGSAGAATAPGGPAPAFDRSDPVSALCELAARVLEVPTVAPDDNFFDRGGHSVLAVRLAKAVRDDWGMNLSVRAVFERPTMAELGGLLTADPTDAGRHGPRRSGSPSR
ncbi:phosphopantetheine-binding protein, partial [Streptomyces sparsus]